MAMTKTRESSGQGTNQRVFSRFSAVQLLEIAFWGTVIWGIARLALHFLHFTPFGLGTYARPFLARADEKTLAGAALGLLVLFIATLLASVLYSLLFSKSRIWWSGLLYGAVLLVLFGSTLRIENWQFATLSTEAAWFLSYGLFVGMTLSLEQSDL